jgi:hypothetical protein
MTYAAVAPSEPGYYWLKSGETEEIVEVWTDPDDPERCLHLHRCGDGNCSALASVTDGAWAGPIDKPD